MYFIIISFLCFTRSNTNVLMQMNTRENPSLRCDNKWKLRNCIHIVVLHLMVMTVISRSLYFRDTCSNLCWWVQKTYLKIVASPEDISVNCGESHNCKNLNLKILRSSNWQWWVLFIGELKGSLLLNNFSNWQWWVKDS
jgi:hypothetical protein